MTWMAAAMSYLYTDMKLMSRKIILSVELFRCVSTADRIWGDGVSQKVVWHVVKEFAKTMGGTKLAPHDLRRYAESQTMPNRHGCGHAGGGLDAARCGMVLTMRSCESGEGPVGLGCAFQERSNTNCEPSVGRHCYRVGTTAQKGADSVKVLFQVWVESFDRRTMPHQLSLPTSISGHSAGLRPRGRIRDSA